jgi:hypothetical protein
MISVCSTGWTCKHPDGKAVVGCFGTVRTLVILLWTPAGCAVHTCAYVASLLHTNTIHASNYHSLVTTLNLRRALQCTTRIEGMRRTSMS